MKLSDAEREKLASLVLDNEHLAYALNIQMQGRIQEFEQVCESPIEALFGAALHLAANYGNYARARAETLYLNEPDRARKPLMPAQWELVPQFVWQGYRIDFAVFTELPYPVFIECDGHDFHERTKEQAARDREKDRRIQDAGIAILRFTGSQIHANALNCGFEVCNFIAKRLENAKKATA